MKQDFDVDRPNAVWAADTTYLRCAEGFTFLVAILDLFSRRVVGWSLGHKLDAELAASALTRALDLRQPEAGLICHSDRGSELTADAFRAPLDASGARQSLSKPGCCYDNAPMESFWGTLKLDMELLEDRSFEGIDEARHALTDYIDRFYNRERRHSTLGYASPVDFECSMREERPAA